MTALASAAFRRQLLARPGLSAEPICPTCQEPTPPARFTSLGICQRCTLRGAVDAARRHASDEAKRSVDLDLLPRRSDGCECGEWGGSEKTCPVHGYGGTASTPATADRRTA